MMEETTREHRSLRALLWWTLLFFTLQLVAALVFGVHEDDGLRWPSLLLPGESVKDAVLLSFSEVETKESTISDGEGLKVAWIMSFGGSVRRQSHYLFELRISSL